MDYSPAFSATSEMTDEELDMYFASYVPLSNLPTPPPAKEASPEYAHDQESISQSWSQCLDRFTHADSQGVDTHATHLANLVPRNVSVHRPHALAIAGFLDRANLPEEIVAFSACLLDSLSSHFAASWRDALAPPSDYARDLQPLLRTDSSRQYAPVSPDVIVLAALSLAHGWLVDRLRGARHWSVRESGGMFSVQEIEATKRAILLDMNYGLFRISEEMVQDRLRDMQRPTPLASDGFEPLVKGVKTGRPRNLSLSLAGTALWCHGVQTPEPSP